MNTQDTIKLLSEIKAAAIRVNQNSTEAHDLINRDTAYSRVVWSVDEFLFSIAEDSLYITVQIDRLIASQSQSLP